ncbi:MAG TPA: ABC transporter ATP-binding protein [Candidatus Dormibacteraeota bacterium]
MAAAVALRQVHKRYRVYRERYRSLKEILMHRRLGEWEDHWVLRGIDLDIERGEMLGIIGANGAGKSTTLKLISRILVPDRGQIEVAGRVSGLLELGAGFQPEYTGRENVFLNASLLGLTRGQIADRLPAIVAFAELEDAIDTPLRTYSSGMYMRLGFSVAVHSSPEILVVDEVLAVGDEAFQHKCLDWIEGFRRQGGTIVLVSHDLGTVRQMCDRVAWIEGGRLRQVGTAADVVDAYVDSVREEESRTEPDAASGTDRPAIELGHVRLLDRAGHAVDSIEAGADLTVEIPYRVHRTVTEPVFGVAIHRGDGLYVYGTNTSVDGVGLGRLAGQGALRLSFPALDLLSGTYRVTVSILGSARPGAPVVDSHYQRYTFRARSAKGDQGLVRLDHEWEVGQPAKERKAAAG